LWKDLTNFSAVAQLTPVAFSDVTYVVPSLRSLPWMLHVCVAAPCAAAGMATTTATTAAMRSFVIARL